MTMQGADPARLRQLARRFDASASQLDQIAAQLTSKINDAQGWKGPDAERFRHEWNGRERAKVTGAVGALREGSKTLDKNAEEQEQASGATPGTVGGGGASNPGESEPAESPESIGERLIHLLEEGHHIVEWGERVLKSLAVIAQDVMVPLEAAAAAAADEAHDVLKWAWKTVAGENWSSAGKWAETGGKWAGRAAVGVGGLIAGWEEWEKDSDDPSLSTWDKIDRTATKAGSVIGGQILGAAVGEWGGAEVGGLLGSFVEPGGGTLVAQV